jgi:hypothetical protein
MLHPNGRESQLRDHMLVFGSKQTRHAFRTWWRKYQRYYDEDCVEREYLPTVRNSKRIKGAIIRYDLPIDTMTDYLDATIGPETRDVWAWIIANSRARVWRTPGAFVFANDVDAVAFKLKWC